MHGCFFFWFCTKRYICMAASSKCNNDNNSIYNYQYYLHHQSFPPAVEQNQMIKMMERKRALRRTKIDWMERSFQEDGKPLEPERRLKLSQDLRLHPHQVLIWFQNQRARWKNKQLQQLYHSLQQENQDLHDEATALRAKLRNLKMEKQKAAESDDTYKEAAFVIAEEAGESKSSIINNQSSNNKIIKQDDHEAHSKQLERLAEDRLLRI